MVGEEAHWFMILEAVKADDEPTTTNMMRRAIAVERTMFQLMDFDMSRCLRRDELDTNVLWLRLQKRCVAIAPKQNVHK